jgi:hypothetical protein
MFRGQASSLSTHALTELHTAIARALDVDDSLPDGQKQYGVREYRDWRQQADAYEAELSVRGAPFTPIEW